jgi:hypothetical protein
MHLPTAIDNSDPSKRQTADSSLMAIASFSPALVVSARPRRQGDRLSRKFVKTLTEKFRTSIPMMNPTSFAAAFRYGSNARELLYFFR